MKPQNKPFWGSHEDDAIVARAVEILEQKIAAKIAANAAPSEYAEEMRQLSEILAAEEETLQLEAKLQAQKQ